VTERPAAALDATTVAEGVARVAWRSGESVDVVRRAIADALTQHHRVEALIALDDQRAQRTAGQAGLLREGVMRGVTVDGAPVDRVLFARVGTDAPAGDPRGFQALLNSVLPRKRGIGQMLIRDTDGRVLLCQLTYKPDWDLPGGVIEVNESPAEAVMREVEEELSLQVPTGRLLLTDWLPPWGGWDDAICLVFDGGEHSATLVDQVIPQAREIASVAFVHPDDLDEVCADFTARRIRSALARIDGNGPGYTESGR
jgi:8-oxo-dGTP pyrophosphatase MutT (NUDIX family)